MKTSIRTLQHVDNFKVWSLFVKSSSSPTARPALLHAAIETQTARLNARSVLLSSVAPSPHLLAACCGVKSNTCLPSPPSILSLITSSNKAAAYTWNHCSRREQKFHQTWNSFFFPCFVETTRCIFSLSSVFSQISFKSAKDQNAGLDWLETGSSLQFACQSPAGLRDKN